MFSHPIDGESELRLLAVSDAEALFMLTFANRAYLRQWLSWVDATKSVTDSKAFIQSTLEQFAANRGFQAGIWYRGSLAGVIGYHPIDWSNRKASLGYWLGEAYTGKGLITRACRILLDHAFGTLRLNRVEIHCATGNTPSCAIPERLGFTHEGVARQSEWLYDHYVDMNIYAMLASNWHRHTGRGIQPA